MKSCLPTNSGRAYILPSPPYKRLYGAHRAAEHRFLPPVDTFGWVVWAGSYNRSKVERTPIMPKKDTKVESETEKEARRIELRKQIRAGKRVERAVDNRVTR